MFGTNLVPEMPEMKDCPFCGERAVWQKYDNLYNVGCENGDCWADVVSNTFYFENLKDAIEFWNYRPLTGSKQAWLGLEKNG